MTACCSILMLGCTSQLAVQRRCCGGCLALVAILAAMETHWVTAFRGHLIMAKGDSTQGGRIARNRLATLKRAKWMNCAFFNVLCPSASQLSRKGSRQCSERLPEQSSCQVALTVHLLPPSQKARSERGYGLLQLMPLSSRGRRAPSYLNYWVHWAYEQTQLAKKEKPSIEYT
jgi:hypothetical protein